MKKTLISFATITAMTMSLNAVEVYNNDNTKVDVYGSVKGLTGYGTYKNSTTTAPEGSTMLSLQSNSRLGVNANIGGLFAKVELGVKDSTISNTIASGFRQLYAGYNFGENYGTLLVGKAISIAGTDFSSDIFFADSGLVGFGNGSQGERRFQVQYATPIGLSFAVMESSFNKQAPEGNGINKTSKSATIPVFAISYDFIGLDDNLIAKIAASYTLINAKTDTNTSNGNTNNRIIPIHAYAINAAATYKTLNKSLYFTAIASYSVNATLYSDTVTPIFNGLHSYDDIHNRAIEIKNDKSNNVTIASAALEVGYSMLDNLAAILGGGFQYSTRALKGSTYNTSMVRSYGAFVQMPYSVNQFLTFIPAVAYYGILDKERSTTVTKTNTSQLLAAIQTKINF